MQFTDAKECEEFLYQLLGGDKEPLVRDAIKTLKLRSSWYEPKLYSDVLPITKLNKFLRQKGVFSIRLLNSLGGKVGNWVVLSLDYKAKALKRRAVQLYKGKIQTLDFYDEEKLKEQITIALSNNDVIEANNLLVLFCTKNPWFFKKKENAELGFMVAEAYLEQDELYHAARWYQCLIKDEPQNPISYLGLGTIYMLLGDLEAALHYFFSGIELNPGHLLLCYNICLLLQSIGEVDMAIEEVEEALKINPQSPFFHKLAGDLKLSDTNRLDEVLEHYKTAVFVMTPDEPQELLIQLLNNYSLALAENDDLAVAEKMLHEALNLNEKREETLLNLSAFYGFYKAENDLAIEYANKALTINSDSGKAYHNLGLAYLTKGNWEKARWYLYKAKKLLPRDYMPLNSALVDLQSKRPRS